VAAAGAAALAFLAFLLGLRLSGAHPAAAASQAAHAVSSTASRQVHAAVAQAGNGMRGMVLGIAWHVAVLAVLALALAYGGSLVLKRARRNVTGH
jgi:hypothetical protein